jgi:hypothetical protein
MDWLGFRVSSPAWCPSVVSLCASIAATQKKQRTIKGVQDSIRQMMTARVDSKQFAIQARGLPVILRKSEGFSKNSRAMFIRNSGIWGLGVLIFALGGGCKKPDPNDSAAERGKQSDNPAATVHWAGIGRLATDTNAAGFLKIWSLPETERLKAQTLDKLALLPWGLPGTNGQARITNYAALVRANRPASLLRSILDDLVQTEWYLEIRESTAQSGQMALAIRLKPERAGVWETNLGIVVESLTGLRQTPVQTGASIRGWEFRATNSSAGLPALARHTQFIRSGSWTLIGLAPQQNIAFTGMLARVEGGQPPLPASAANDDWLQATIDLGGLSAALSWGWKPPQDWPIISLSVTGDGASVLTRGLLKFPKPLPFQIEPWNVPTNLIHEPLHSFTAVQGLKPWISSLPWWQNLHVGAAPNQLFCWAQGATPLLNYAAAPVSNAEHVISRLGPEIMQDLNPLLEGNRMGKWEPATNSDGVVWRGPIIDAFVQSAKLVNGSFLFGGLSPLIITNSPPPSGTLSELLSQSNVVYFDREITTPRLEAWMYSSQLFRIILRRAQLPSEARAVAWFKAAEPLLGTSKTTMRWAGVDSLSVERSSGCGFTSIELHLLTDWLESSQFPLRMHSEVSKLPAFSSRQNGNNGTPSPIHRNGGG